MVEHRQRNNSGFNPLNYTQLIPILKNYFLMLYLLERGDYRTSIYIKKIIYNIIRKSWDSKNIIDNFIRHISFFFRIHIYTYLIYYEIFFFYYIIREFLVDLNESPV